MNITNKFMAEVIKIDAGAHNIPTLGANSLFANGLNLIYFAAGTVAVIIIIVAGFMYATSGGNAANITKAKNALMYAVIGLVVVALAFVITQFVIGRFQQ